MTKNEPNLNRVSKSINRPLTIWGAERRLFFLAVVMGAATFNFFASLVSGLLMFGALYAFARWATAVDTQILKIVLNSSKFRTHYDPARREAFQLERTLNDGSAR
ncbi:MAG: VirB3 family type IV secretion system protein [Bryobacteraceae bacterium]|nr:VirB3 family type IV secretion system protein [Bryobacteraceae bacterium]